MCILGYLNGWIGDGVRAGITSAFGVHKGGKESRRSGGKEDDISGASEERYAALRAGREGSKRNETRPIRSPCSFVQG